MQHVCLILIFFGLSLPAQAQYFQAELMKKRLSNKESSRWTLGDWMAQKNKISIWDQWLAMNRSANWFELQLSGSQFEYEQSETNSTGLVESNNDFTSYSAGLWISIFGLSAEMQDWAQGETSQSGQFNIRLFGTSLQSTHLILGGGVQKLELENTGERWENTYASAILKLYYLKYIGLRGEYRKYFPKESNLGAEREGYLTRTGMFIEVGILQLFGNYWRQPMELTSSTSTISRERDGIELGVSLIF